MADRPLLAACAGDTVRLWALPQQQPAVAFKPQPAAIGSLAWNHNNKVLATGLHDGRIGLFHANGTQLHQFPAAGRTPSAIFSVAWSHNSRFLASGSANADVHLYDMKPREVTSTYKGHAKAVTWLTFNWDATVLASSSLAGHVLLHSVARPLSYGRLSTAEPNGVHAVSFSPFHRTWLATAGDSGTVALYDATTEACLWELGSAHSAPCIGVQFSAANKLLLASAGFDGQIAFFDVQDKKKMNSIPLDAPANSLAFKDDGVTVAVGTSEGSISVFDLRAAGQGPLVTLFREFSQAVTSLSFQTRSARKSKAVVPPAASVRAKATSTQRRAVLNAATAAAAGGSRGAPTPRSAPQAAPPAAPGSGAKPAPRAAGGSPRVAPSPGPSPAAPQSPTRTLGEGLKLPLGAPSATSTPSRTPRPAEYTGSGDPADIFSPIPSRSDARPTLIDLPPSYMGGDKAESRKLKAPAAASPAGYGRSVFTPEAAPPPSRQKQPTPTGASPGLPAASAPKSEPLPEQQRARVRFEARVSSSPSRPKATPSAATLGSAAGKRPLSSTAAGAANPTAPYLATGTTASPALPPAASAFATAPTGAATSRAQGSQPSPHLPSTMATSRPRPPLPTHHQTAPGAAAAPQGLADMPAAQSFQTRFIKNMIEASLEDFRFSLHRDVHNMHLELLRQFEMQKSELRRMMEEHSVNGDLVEEIRRLREENSLLKQSY